MLMKHEAPCTSKDHQVFISLAPEIGASTTHIRKLFWLINAPSQLTAFIQIASNFLWLLEETHADNLSDYQPMIQDWHKVLQYTVDHADVISQRVGEHTHALPRRSRGKYIHPLRGKGMLKHTLYTALWNNHEEPRLQHAYSKLQAHMLFAHIKLMQDVTTLEGYEQYVGEKSILSGGLNDSVSKACRLLRDLSLLDCKADLIYLMGTVEITQDGKPKETVSLISLPSHVFNTHLSEQHKELRGQAQNESTKVFGLFFKHAYVDTKTSKRKGGGKHTRHRYMHHDGYIQLSPTLIKRSIVEADINERDTYPVSHSIVQEHAESEDFQWADISEEENSTGNEVHLFDFKEGDTRPYLSRILAAHAQVRHQSIANQMLRNRWSLLNLWEVAILSEQCKKILSLPYPHNSKEVEKWELAQETATIILIMLWTGSGLERAIKTAVFKSREKGFAELAYLHEEQAWRIPNLLLQYRTRPTAAQLRLSRERANELILPDILNIGKWILKVKARKMGQRVFSHNLITYQRSIRYMLNLLPEGHRVTEKRIAGFLLNQILADQKGDLATAILSTVSPHPLGQTLLHYTSPNMEALRDCYCNTIRKTQQNITKELGNACELEADHTLKIENQSFGSRLCPTFSSVVTFAEQLGKTIKSGPQSRSFKDYVRYHNMYTVYTAQMIGYATGFRAIKNPFIHAHDIDADTGFAVISDKDGSDFYNSRLVWVPPTVQQQLVLYAKHRQGFLIDHLAKADDSLTAQNLPSMFLLTDKLKVLDLKPKYVSEMLEDIFPLPLNVNRRFLRTTLQEQGCPTEVINCFMGHWSRGEEPWSKHSSFSFADYTRELQSLLPSLLAELSWVPRRSLLMI